MLFRVQHLVRDASLLQLLRQQLRGFDRRRADQHRLLALPAIGDLVDDRLELVFLGQEHEVGPVITDHRAVRRDHDDLQPVDLLELEGLGVGRAGHTRELVVDAEEVLEGDRRDGLVFFLDVHALLRLDGLVQAVGPATARHRAAGELVDDDDLAALYDVFVVARVQVMRAQRRRQVVQQPDVSGIVQCRTGLDQPGLRHQLLCVLVALLGQVDLLRLAIQREVAALFIAELRTGAAQVHRVGRGVLDLLQLEFRRELVDALVQVGALLRRARDDQRGARLVDQDRVDLIDDRERQLALHAVLEAEGQVVAQVVEAELVVGCVGDVGEVGGPLVLGAHATADHANGQPEQLVDGSHPVGVTLGQVLVDRDDVHAVAVQRIQVGRAGGHQGLALAGAHLADVAVVQHHRADQLHVVVAHAERASGGFPDQRKRLDHQVVQRLPVVVALAQRVGARFQFGVIERLELVFERVDALDDLVVPADQPLVAAAENP